MLGCLDCSGLVWDGGKPTIFLPDGPSLALAALAFAEIAFWSTIILQDGCFALDFQPGALADIIRKWPGLLLPDCCLLLSPDAGLAAGRQVCLPRGGLQWSAVWFARSDDQPRVGDRAEERQTPPFACHVNCCALAFCSRRLAFEVPCVWQLVSIPDSAHGELQQLAECTLHQAELRQPVNPESHPRIADGAVPQCTIPPWRWNNQRPALAPREENVFPGAAGPLDFTGVLIGRLARKPSLIPTALVESVRVAPSGTWILFFRVGLMVYRAFAEIKVTVNVTRDGTATYSMEFERGLGQIGQPWRAALDAFDMNFLKEERQLLQAEENA